MFVEPLPFQVVSVSAPAELRKVTQLRYEAYARHLPTFAQSLVLPELRDFEDDNIVFLAVSKEDSMPLATMRIHTNRNRPLPLEEVIALPDKMRFSTLSEAGRFCVASTHIYGKKVKVARNVLFKAYYLFCVANNVEWMVICARNPVHKLFLNLLFNDISPNGNSIPLPYLANIPHRVLALRVCEVEPLWREANHSLYNFFFCTHHPDLEIPGEGD